MAEYSGLETVIETPSSDISKNTSGILTTQASLHGIPAVILELFGGYVRNGDVDYGSNIVTNILKGLDVVKGIPKGKDQKIYTKLIKIYSPESGIIQFMRDLGGDLGKGQVYAEIYNLLTEEKINLKAPDDRILGFRVSFGVLNKGDYLGEFLVESKEKPL